MDVLLINPPFAMPDKPCISIPVLAAYLKQRGVHVQGLDANIEFYRRFLSPENIQSSRRFAKKRILELESKVGMTIPEKSEYARLVGIITESEPVHEQLSSLFEPHVFSNVEKFSLFRVALHLVSVPHYPEWLGFTEATGYIRYISKYHKFSSSAIIQSLEDTALHSEYLEDILRPVLQQHSPSLVGISLSFPDQVFSAFRCAQIVKRWCSDIHVTIGGAFVSCHMRELTNIDLFDVVDSFIVDDGEVPLEALIRELSSSAPDFSNVPGLMYSSGGKIVKNASVTPLSMDQLPTPDYSIFLLDRYLIKRESMALLFRLSRGCSWAKCAFCRTELPLIYAYSQPSSDHLFKQLQAVIEQTGVHIFHFTDDAASPEILEELSRKLIEAGLNIKWAVNVRFDRRLTLERLLLYKQAGCRCVYIGLESYTERMMKLMRKGISEALVEKVLSNLSWVGIPAVVYMIVGFPAETKEEAWESYHKLVKLKEQGLIRRVIYNIFELNAYSPVSAHPEKFGITHIPTKEGADLMPPITDLESEGMTREEAYRLCAVFTQMYDA